MQRGESCGSSRSSRDDSSLSRRSEGELPYSGVGSHLPSCFPCHR
jgi:hypothetical protein